VVTCSSPEACALVCVLFFTCWTVFTVVAGAGFEGVSAGAAAAELPPVAGDSYFEESEASAKEARDAKVRKKIKLNNRAF